MTHSLPEDGERILSSSGRTNHIEDDRMIAVILSEEYATIDGTIRQQVPNFHPARHVPRVNSFVPTLGNGNHDHERLNQRLSAYGLIEMKVSGDGNCQFRALSDQIFKSAEHHKFVRKTIVQQLKDQRSFYEGYVPMSYKKYCKKMGKSGEWGDHVTLQAAADKFHVKIFLVTSFRDTCFVEIVPQCATPQRELWLSLWSEVHYNSLYAHRDIQIRQKPKKKHWLF
ncbi:cysteine proteinases superfamily protein [Wolffia australiana]